MPDHAAVKAEIQCSERPEHIIGAVGRQVRAVPGSPAGTVSINDMHGRLIREQAPDGSVKLRGRCLLCSQNGTRPVPTPERRWEWFVKLLDYAEGTEDGVVRVPMPLH